MITKVRNNKIILKNNFITLEDLFINLPINIFWKNEKLEYMGCNQIFLDLLGVSSIENILGKTDIQIGLKEATPGLCKTGDEEILKTGNAILNREEILLLPNQKRIVLLVNKVPLLSSNNNVIGILGYIIDITNRKSAEQEFLESIIAKMPGYIFWKNRQSVYMGCNDNLLIAAGLKSRSDFIGKTDSELFWGKSHGDNFKKVDIEIMETKVGKFNFEENLLKSDGTLVTVLTNKIPLEDEKGNAVGVLAISSDITERKKMEQSLVEAKERAEAANKSKSEFFSAINHELRTPLTGMLGMARLLSSEPLAPEHKDQIKDIITAGEHLLSLVNDLLDIAKLEAGKLELNPAPIDLRNLTEEIATMLSSQAKLKQLEMRVNYVTDTPHLIIADGKAIRQILLNLVGNSLKFTHEGHIELKVECLKQTSEETELKISVNDTGIGIPKDKIDAVFERFNQVDSSRTRKYGGTGLGLTINKAYVELMGGEIKIESEEGKGSTFSCILTFPLQAENKITSTWEPYKSNVRILIADDSLNGEVIKKHIGSSLCEIVSGAEIINYLLIAQQRNQPFHIVMMDQQLKTVDPIELAKKINTLKSVERPMLLYLIQPCPITERNVLKAEGFFECFIKPLHPTELLISLTAAWEKWQERLKPQNAIVPLDSNTQFKVLLVEDDPIIQKVHGMMLKKIGCQVDIANNGPEALAMFNNGYDAIFMDIGLGEMSGMDVAIEIRRQEINGVHLPIIAMTGYGDEDSKNSCLAAGMNDITVKPTTPEHLKELLEHWVVKVN